MAPESPESPHRAKTPERQENGAFEEGAGSWLDRADRRLLAAWDGEVARAYDLAGEHMACRAGCHECCVGPFGISALDARRLRIGLASLETRDGERSASILRRARQAVERLSVDFPGDSRRGVLDGGDEEAEEGYLDRHADLPCPALDPRDGTCELYAHRPLTCRSYGPPLTLGGGTLAPCRLCFLDAEPEEVEACRIDPDPEGLEDTVLDAVEREAEEPLGGATLIAFALLDFREGVDKLPEVR